MFPYNFLLLIKHITINILSLFKSLKIIIFVNDKWKVYSVIKMSQFNRKTEYWVIPTPAKVGPGAYEVLTPKKSRQCTAPFKSSEMRSLSVPLSKKNDPGPGSYIHDEKVKQMRKSRVTTFSAIPREIQFPNEDGIKENPGPGSYAIEEKHKVSYKGRQNHKPLSLILEPSPVSIPAKMTPNQEIGPFSYNPRYSKTKPSTRTTDFSAYKSTRPEIFTSNTEIPGPGQYNNDSPQKSNKKLSWTFKSKVKRKSIEKSENPGPGTYRPQLPGKQTKALAEGFGSTTERDVMLSNDPHRPYAYENISPPVGIYDYEKSHKNDLLRKKLLLQKKEHDRPSFNATEKRVFKLSSNEYVPGPGLYELSSFSHYEENLYPFGIKSPRFKEKKPAIIPGPGSYENKADNQMKTGLSSLVSNTQRFDKDMVCSGEQISTEFYIGHQPWKVKKTRADDSELKFDSSSPRFQDRRDLSPGPGQYHKDFHNKKPKIYKYTEKRFSSYANYTLPRGTSDEIGPGAYHQDMNFYKKSFNISGELSECKPWL
ncbi:unnamed protein product [Blepharisma stoltei]|uniref:Sperm-tail PG-rich repeat-containing protein 2 n=1 Tax=Blepharisma stoltei TaxID=1481888 RepID=A0AAU9JBS9_9CILI|nr:unnamed protein product [Blepharisma stoltei]